MKNFRTGNSCIPLAAASENIDQKHHLCGANQQVSAITIDGIMLILLIMKAHSITATKILLKSDTFTLAVAEKVMNLACNLPWGRRTAIESAIKKLFILRCYGRSV